MDAVPETCFHPPDDGRVKHDPVADPRPARVRDMRGRVSAFDEREAARAAEPCHPSHARRPGKAVVLAIDGLIAMSAITPIPKGVA